MLNDVSFEKWLTPEILGNVLPILKISFWVLTVFLIVILLKRSVFDKQHKTISRAYRIFFFLVALLFAGILAYQATWQLAGFARPDFIQFMKRYNRRPDNPAAKMVRGNILDSRGVQLAATDPDVPGQRWYPHGESFCHIIGYEHPVYGMTGVESAEHALLSGMTVDNGPEWERFRRNLMKREDIRGNDLVLTLDATLQDEAHKLMKGKKGAVVCLDPATGAILVLYSSPGYDPNKLQPSIFARKDPDARLLNRALQGLYPAGSTFKVLVAGAALEKGINPLIDCPAEGYKAGTGKKPIRDHEYYEYQRNGRVWPGHGRLNMRDALAKSSNVYFARLGVQVGGENLHATAVRCGFTRSWMIYEGSSDSINGSSGRFPPLTDRDLAKTAQVSIGQGDMLVTPLHIAMLAGAIGRQGVAWKPHLSVGTEPEPLEPFFTADTAKTLAGMMRHSIINGTGRMADIPGLSVAGKTGTAQNPHGADHGWFMGFAPSVQPRIAFAIIVEQGGFGSQSALPVAAGILRKAQALGMFDAQPEKVTR
jgi:penicillin-binding protein A